MTIQSQQCSPAIRINDDFAVLITFFKICLYFVNLSRWYGSPSGSFLDTVFDHAFLSSCLRLTASMIVSVIHGLFCSVRFDNSGLLNLQCLSNSLSK